MPTYPFLSDEWITETRKLREQYRSQINAASLPKVRMNLVVNSVPDRPEPLDAHLDTSGGEPELELGHLDKPNATVTVDYDTARTIFVDGRLSAAMEAMQLGRISVKGNIFKLMSLGSLNNDPGSKALAEEIRKITA